MKVNVLIDSHGWVEYFAEGKLASKYARYVEAANTEHYFTPAIILYEVYKRIKNQRDEGAALKAVAHIIANTTIISIDKNIALNAAEISLRTKLAMADAIIKAAAEENSAKIVTGDDDFKGLPDVIFID